MKEFELKKNSWHYKLVTVGSPEKIGELEYGVDLCKYIWMVIWAACMWAIMIWLFAGLCYAVGFSWYSVFNYFAFGEMISEGAFVTLVGQGIILAMFGVLALYVWYKEREVYSKREPGFVVLSYRKFKDKTCSRINFK